MAYLLVESFSQGLDTRRSILTSKPGTLQSLVNAHITRGGEIEKRKAFVATYALPAGLTFGMLAVKNNIYTFGSTAAGSVTVPPGVAYQRLQHKDGTTAMTGVLKGENFDGKPYVVAMFADGAIFHYYNGVRITTWDDISSTTGDNDGIAESFANLIDLMPEFIASAAGSVITITAAVVNKPFTPTVATVDGGSYAASAYPPFIAWVPLNDQLLTAVKTQAATVSLPEIWTVTVSGTFQVLDSYSIRLVIPGTPDPSFDQYFYVQGGAVGVAQFVKTLKTKMYAITRSLLYFSEINSPQIFNTNKSGSGFINMSNQDGGSEELTALANYQGKLAVFSKNNIQIWSMDPDPLKNVQNQVLNSIGTSAPRSVCNYGDVDVFFLSDSGIRSIKARDASNSAAVSDVGVYIDNVVSAHVAASSETDVANAVGIVEPREGRYMLAIGSKIFVYTYFPTPNISAWSVYEPGFTISDFAYAANVVHARSGDTIYTLGGLLGDTYDDCRVEVILPYLDAGKPAHGKAYKALDCACDGKWTAWVNFDTSSLQAYDRVADIENSTFDFGKMSGAMRGTHIGVKMIHENSPGYARISNLAIHYKGGEDDKS